LATINVAKNHTFSWYEKIYFYSVFHGLLITMKHFLKTAFLRKAVTIEFPEKKREYSSRLRGLHSMKRDEEGRERCTACFCCMWICPADAIKIEAGQVTAEIQHLHPEDKYPKKFEIDLLRCIFCGLCEEACPKEAIFLTDRLVPTYFERDNFIYGKDKLVETLDERIDITKRQHTGKRTQL